MNPTKPLLLALHFLSEEHRAQMGELLQVIYAPSPAERAAAVA